MSSDKPHFFTRDLSGSNSRSFLCPLCKIGGLIDNEVEFLDHAKRYHSERTVDAPEGPRWKEMLNEAASRARQEMVKRLAPDPVPELSKRSSTDSMKPYVGDAASHSTFSRPVSGSGAKQTEPNPKDMERLNLGQAISRDTHSGAPGVIPLKRPANQFGSPEVKVPGEERGKKGRVRGESTTDFNRASKSGSGRQPYDPVSDSLSTGRSQLAPAPAALQGRGPKPHSQHPLKQGSYKQGDSTISPKGRGHVDAVSTSRNFDYNNFNRVEINLEQAEPIDPWDAELLLQPETRPISHDQLVHEVKGIYAGLVMVEAKCIDVDGKQTAAARERESAKKTQLTQEQWSALTALHKTLLHEHHDFFLASQHPSASPALTKLAEKYSMPARMWKHGIHAFLEVLRLRLPESLDHMLAFIYIAYSMMALLYETVPSFENTWIECLGDLGRYRMAIGDEDVKDREVWSGVARFWYEKAAEKNPQIGRLHHHLAILARPYTVQQLSLYTRALTAVVPFEGAKTSLRTLIGPVFSGQQLASFKPASVEVMLTKCIAFLYTGRSGDPFNTCVHQLVSSSFNRYIERLGGRFKEIGVFAFHCASGALLEFGSSQPQPKGASRALIRRAFDDLLRQRLAQQDDIAAEPTAMPASPVSPTLELSIHEIEESKSNIAEASKLFFGLLTVALRRPHDKNVQPMIHSYLALIRNLAASDLAMQLLERDVPWSLIVSYLNHHTSSKSITSHVLRKEFPKPDGDVIGRPLPEDFVLRGQISMDGYFPATWFSDADVDDEERVMELPSMTAPRTERILWLGHRISTYNRWMTFNGVSNKFEETQYVKDMPSPQMSATVDPSIASTETETLVTDPMDDEKMALDETGMADEARRNSELGGQEQELRSPRETLISTTPAMLKQEPTEDVEMKNADKIKQEPSERTYASSKSQYRSDFPKGTRSPAPFKNKYFNAAPRGVDPVRILSDADDPTDP